MNAIDFDFDDSPRARADAEQTQLGKTVTLPPTGGITHASQPSSWSTVIYTPEYPIPIDWDIVLQAVQPPTGGGILFRVTYTLGMASFTKKPRALFTQMAQRFHVTGRRVQVDVVNLATSGPAIDVSGAVGRSVVASPRDWYLSQWVPSNAGAALDTGPGVLMAYQALLTTMTGDAQAYVSFYDTAGTAPSDSQPSLWDSPAFTDAPEWASFTDLDDPRLVYSNGLYVALTSTPGIYTASSGAGAATVQTKIGW